MKFFEFDNLSTVCLMVDVVYEGGLGDKKSEGHNSSPD